MSSSVLILIEDEQARLEFDPVDTSDSPLSTAFNITFTWVMPFQSRTIVHRDCWFAHDELNEFQTAVADLNESESGEAVLRNMDDLQVLTIIRSGNTVSIRYHTADHAALGDVVFTVATFAEELASIEERFRSYPSWW